jgi:tetratricopeptide (TPR) repeat protein
MSKKRNRSAIQTDNELSTTRESSVWDSLGAVPHPLVIVLLVASVLAVYWQVTKHEFIIFDDNIYIYENKMVQSGLNWESMVWAFATGTLANWHPLTWLSIMVDYQLFGLNAGLHHLMGAILHAINTALLFVVFSKMTKSFWPSVFVAAFFGLHPLHVESVAWASERKDVLSAFFWILTLLLYARYVDRPGLRRYLLVIVSFALGLLAKPMLVTLPFVLLLLDYWPLKRFQIGGISALPTQLQAVTLRDSTGRHPERQITGPAKEKIPLFILSAISCVVTFIAQQSGGAVFPLERLPITIRLGNAFVSYITYIRKMIWPSGLAFYYPHPGFALSLWWSVSAAGLVLALTVAFLWFGRKRSYLAVGWLWYIGTLVPVIGIVQVGIQALADRYTYIPLIGLSIIIAWGAQELLGNWRYRSLVFTVAGISSLLALSILTWFQIATWRNNMSVFSHAVAVTERNVPALTNLAIAESRLGKTDDAIAHFKEALQISPKMSDVHNYLGIALSNKGKDLEAASHYAQAIRLKPDHKEAHVNLGIVLERQGITDSAIVHFREALRLDPDDAQVHNNLGAALGKLGKVDEAIEHFEKASRLRPEYPSALYNLGSALLRQKKYDEAILRLSEAVHLKPDDADAHYNLGLAFKAVGDVEQAIAHFDQVLTLNPSHKEASYEFLRLTNSQNQRQKGRTKR